MVRFLLSRPIAVLMSLIAIVILGVVSLKMLPVSMLPDIDVPEITVMLNYNNTSARELEKAIVSPLRNQLLQVEKLKDIRSETRDGNSVIRLFFEYGTDINFAFLETNEKIDAAMPSLPRNMDRPRVIKAGASDIPVFYLNILPKAGYYEKSENLLEISELCRNVIQKQLEGLPDVAMTDLTGLDRPVLKIIPNDEALRIYGLSYDEIETVLRDNNIEPGNIVVNSGHYQYHLKMASVLRSPDDVAGLYIKCGNRILQLKDIAKVELQPEIPDGVFMSGNRRGISFAIIKQSSSQIGKLKEQVNETVAELEERFPELEFSITRDQCFLLDYSIENMKQNLAYGILLGFLVLLVFLKDFRSAFLIFLSIPVALIISLFFLYIAGLSINILTLAGLILAGGMMVDNSIIVIDNIWYYRNSGLSAFEAAVKGTNMVITPMLSSVLTTCAVFVPLIFLSGLSGALFFDQAVSVSIGLMVSYLVAIIILPVLYCRISGKSIKPGNEGKVNRLVTRAYDAGYKFVFRRKILSIFLFMLLLPLGYFSYRVIGKEVMPSVEYTDVTLTIDWNENVTVDENSARCIGLLAFADTFINYSNSYVGRQQFILDREQDKMSNEAVIYMGLKKAGDATDLKESVLGWFGRLFPEASFQFEKSKNIFEQLFVAESNAPLIAKLQPASAYGTTDIVYINNLIDSMKKMPGGQILSSVPANPVYECNVSFDKISLYQIDYQNLVNLLKSAFDENRIDYLRTGNKYIPIKFGKGADNLFNIISSLRIMSKNGRYYPVSELVTVSQTTDFKSIRAGMNGEEIPLCFDADESDYKEIENSIKEMVAASGDYRVEFDGSLHAGEKMIMQLLFILGISVLLLYFILAAQFESLLLPVIVLLELPFGIGFAIFLLLVTGHSLNIMSAIGIVIMVGIVINDSILKIDTINHLLREKKYKLLDAIHEGGRQKLYSILMTSLTTIFAMLPIFFSGGIGAELQTPLAIAIIGGLGIGTIISLYFIPLLYYFIFKRSETAND